MNQQIVDYIQTNKKEYTKESLIEQLRNNGYDVAEITEAVSSIYGDAEVIVQMQNDDMNNDVRYAGFWIRVAAMVVDYIVMFILFLPIAIIMHLLISGMYIMPMILLPFSAFVLSFAYFLFMTNKYQATIGKKLFGLKVCNEKTLQKATFMDIMNREGISRLIMFLFAPIHIAVAFMNNKQGVHDMAANTVVIYRKK